MMEQKINCAQIAEHFRNKMLLSLVAKHLCRKLQLAQVKRFKHLPVAVLFEHIFFLLAYYFP